MNSSGANPWAGPRRRHEDSLPAPCGGRALARGGIPDTTTAQNNIFPFDSASPGSPGTLLPITGLQSGEVVQGIDFRPANGQLYGVGSSSTLYTINTATGAATPVGPLGVPPVRQQLRYRLNPTADRLRIVSDADQNLEVDPATGNAPSAGSFPSSLFVRGLAAAPPPPGGDFDLDGDVDAADLLVLRRGLTVSPNGVDLTVRSPDGLGAVDALDYLQWRANFGQSAGGGSARASQRRRAVVLVNARRRVTLKAGERKRVRLPLTRAGKRFIRSYKKKRLRVTLRFTVRHRPATGAATQRTFKRKVTLRVKRRQR